MGGAGADGQQVVVARDVAVPGQVVRVLGVSGNRRTPGSLDDADGRLWGGSSRDETISGFIKFSLYLITSCVKIVFLMNILGFALVTVIGQNNQPEDAVLDQ